MFDGGEEGGVERPLSGKLHRWNAACEDTTGVLRRLNYLDRVNREFPALER